MTDDIATDRLEGVAAIATFLGVTKRRASYLLEKGVVPAGQVGKIWTASKRRLREDYHHVTSGEAA